MNKIFTNISRVLQAWSLVLVSLISVLPFSQVSAQTALEFNSSSGSTANGPTVANQTFTFLNDTDNATTGTTFAAFSPKNTATFSRINQQYTLGVAPNFGVMFGGGPGTFSISGIPINSLMNSIGLFSKQTKHANSKLFKPVC